MLALASAGCGAKQQRDAEEPGEQSAERASADELFREAMTAEKDGAIKEAASKYQRAVDLAPDDFKMVEHYAKFLIAHEQPEKATKVASRFLSGALGETKAYHLLADAQMASRDWLAAYATLSELIELDGGDGAAYEKRGRVQEQRESYADAIEDLKKAIELEPESADFRASLGSALERGDRLDEAALELRNAIQLEPRHGKAHVLLGIVLRKQGDHAEALKMHRMAVKFEPGSARAHFELGVSQNYMGDNPGAEISLKKATELEPDDALNWYAFGEILRTMKRYSEAVAPYRKALDLDPDHTKAANKLGLVLFKAGMLEEAETVLTDRIRKKPDDPYTYFNLGEVYAGQEKYRLAVEAFEKFVELAPKDDVDMPAARKQIKILKRKIPPYRPR